MDIVTSSYLPGDPRLIDQIVYELKSQGIFDQFRKECIADVDTKPAYQNLSQRVEGSVMNFLKKQTYSENMNKNQLREQLRKNIAESGFLETGVERIVDQVVNPKINTVFLPKVEDVVYRFLGIEKPNPNPNVIKLEVKTDVEDLLPNDLEAISPESVQENSFNSNSEKKDECIETNENSLNSSNTKTEDESPPFELLEENTKFSVQEENSVDSHLSGISGLASHESDQSKGVKDENQMDITQDNSQNSLNSEGNLSIVTSEDDTKMEICEDSNMAEHNEIKKEISSNNDNAVMENKIVETKEDEADGKERTEKIEEKIEEVKIVNEIKMDDKKDVKKSDDKKTSENRNDSKRSHDKHKSSRSDKDRKDDKEKRSRSKSENKSKDHKDSKSHSKHSSSSKDKDKDKDKKDYRNGKDKEDGSEKEKVKKDDKERDKSKDKSSKSKEKSEKDCYKPEKDKMDKEKEKSDKEKINKDKSDKNRSDRDKEKSDREKSRSEKEKNKSDRDKDKVDKDKTNKDKSEKERSSSSKHSKEKSSSSSKKDSSSKEKDKNEDKSSRDRSSSNKDKIVSSNSKHKDSSSKDKDSSKTSKDKERSKSSSSSSSKDKEKKGSGDSKSRSSDKHKKDKDKSSYSIKKDKDKKAVDDHYSLKDKKSERRSTDRDSNDGSSKMSRNGSFTESYSQSLKGSSKESSEVFSSGSGDSSNSDKMEEKSVETTKEVENVDEVKVEAPQTIKYMKPKFASNIHEAMKIMKIRKQLAKLERQNQLSLAQVAVSKDSGTDSKVGQNLRRLSIVLEKTPLIPNPAEDKLSNEEKIEVSMEGKSDKEKPHVLSDKQRIKNKQSYAKITCDKIPEDEPLKMETPNSEKLTAEETLVLKSQDLSMETFEALEARLAQEMSNINYNMYGDEDDDYNSVTFSPVKKRKASEEPKHSIKKLRFDALNASVNGGSEVELIASNQVTVSLEEIGQVTESKEVVHVPVIETRPNVEHHCDIAEQNVPSDETCIRGKKSNIFVNGEELVINEVYEESIDYIQETVINDVFEHQNSDAVVEDKKEELEEAVDSIPETTQDVYEKCDVEIEKKILDNDQQTTKQDIALNDDPDEFRGFNDVDKDHTNVIRLTEQISELRNILEILSNTDKSYIVKDNVPMLNIIGKDRINFRRQEDRVFLKRELSVEATLKEVTNIPSTLQDMLQKNGKKLFIKIDKSECELPSKVLVTLQGMGMKKIDINPLCEITRGSHQEVEKSYSKGTTQIFGEFRSNSEMNVSSKSKSSELVGQIDQMTHDFKWEDDNSPCYYFDKSNSTSDKHLIILNNMIERLEKVVQERSLHIQNNIPSAKQRGKKRKAQSTDNNNSISAPWKPDPKRKQLSDVPTHRNGANLCNTNVPHNQSFSLPLSPAESEKSYEHKKEEPVTVRTKRTGRVSSSKRYSSEDLYKPRPVLRCSSTRRRGLKSEKT